MKKLIFGIFAGLLYITLMLCHIFSSKLELTHPIISFILHVIVYIPFWHVTSEFYKYLKNN